MLPDLTHYPPPVAAPVASAASALYLCTHVLCPFLFLLFYDRLFPPTSILDKLADLCSRSIGTNWKGVSFREKLPLERLCVQGQEGILLSSLLAFHPHLLCVCQDQSLCGASQSSSVTGGRAIFLPSVFCLLEALSPHAFPSIELCVVTRYNAVRWARFILVVHTYFMQFRFL